MGAVASGGLVPAKERKPEAADIFPVPLLCVFPASSLIFFEVPQTEKRGDGQNPNLTE